MISKAGQDASLSVGHALAEQRVVLAAIAADETCFLRRAHLGGRGDLQRFGRGSHRCDPVGRDTARFLGRAGRLGWFCWRCCRLNTCCAGAVQCGLTSGRMNREIALQALHRIRAARDNAGAGGLDFRRAGRPDIAERRVCGAACTRCRGRFRRGCCFRRRLLCPLRCVLLRPWLRPLLWLRHLLLRWWGRRRWLEKLKDILCSGGAGTQHQGGDADHTAQRSDVKNHASSHLSFCRSGKHNRSGARRQHFAGDAFVRHGKSPYFYDKPFRRPGQVRAVTRI